MMYASPHEKEIPYRSVRHRLQGRGALGRRGISTVLDFVMLTVLSISWALVLVCAMFHALRRWL
jgi:hypothetical protein